MELALQTAAQGAVVSVFYALMAIGFTLIFGIMGVLNLAHGELYMLGAYVVWLGFAEGSLPFPVAVALGAAIVAGIGISMERAFFRPMQHRPLMGLILSVSMIFILQVIVATTWHVGLMKQIPPMIKGSLEILGASAPWQRLLVLPVAGTLLGGLWYFLRRVKQGQALRATAQDPEVASLQGINVDRIRILSMVIGAALAGTAGGLMAPILRVDPYMGHAALIQALVITIVGGLGSIEGALIASFIFGFMNAFVTVYADGTIAMIIAVLLMFVILGIRPRGLMGRA